MVKIKSVDLSIKKEAEAREEAKKESNNKAANAAPELVVSKGCSIIDSLLVSDFLIHLGWTTPLIVFCITYLGTKLRSSFLSNVDCAILGRYD